MKRASSKDHSNFLISLQLFPTFNKWQFGEANDVHFIVIGILVELSLLAFCFVDVARTSEIRCHSNGVT